MDDELYGYGAVKEILTKHSDLGDGVEALLRYCKQRCPHPAWDEMAGLPYAADADAMRAWLVGRLPIPDAVEVVWFAPWDVVTGLDLRGSTSWSRDPEDWEWWYRDDFDAGGYESPVLAGMLDVARRAENPEDGPDIVGGVSELTDWVLAAGYVSLAAIWAMRTIEAAPVLGGRRELWAVSGFPDAVYGIILGRLTSSGFDAFTQTPQ